MGALAAEVVARAVVRGGPDGHGPARHSRCFRARALLKTATLWKSTAPAPRNGCGNPVERRARRPAHGAVDASCESVRRLAAVDNLWNGPGCEPDRPGLRARTPAAARRRALGTDGRRRGRGVDGRRARRAPGITEALGCRRVRSARASSRRWRSRERARPRVTAERRLTLGESLALAAFAAASLRQFGWIVFERAGVVLTLLPYNYGDLPLHWTYIRHMAGGASFWPENPIFTGARLRYPLGVDMLSAAAVQLGAALPCGAARLRPARRRPDGAGPAPLGRGASRSPASCARAASRASASSPPGGSSTTRRRSSGRACSSRCSCRSAASCSRCPSACCCCGAGAAGCCAASPRCRRGSRPRCGVRCRSCTCTRSLFVSLLWLVWVVVGGRWRDAVPGLALALAPATWAAWQVTGGPGAASLVGWSPGWTIGSANPLVFLAVNFGLFLPLALVALVVALRERQREHAARARALARGVRGAVLRPPRALGLGQHEGDAVVLRRGAAGDRRAGAGAARAALARLRPCSCSSSRGRESVVAASAGPRRRLDVFERGEYEARLRGRRTARPRRARRDGAGPQPPGGAVRAADRGRLRGPPLEPRHRRADGRGRPRAADERRGRLPRGGARLSARATCSGARARPVAFPRSTRPWQAAPLVASGPWGMLSTASS